MYISNKFIYNNALILEYRLCQYSKPCLSFLQLGFKHFH